MKVALVMLSASCILAGCATATLVESEPGKRIVISINPQDSAEARSKAASMAQGECGSKKAVLAKQGRVAVGTHTQGESNESPQKNQTFNVLSGKMLSSSSKKTESSSNTVNTYEWQLVYECS